MNTALIEFEASLWEWSSFRTISGDAGFVPDSFVGLVSQGSENDAMSYYWDIENSVFVQGRLFESAEPTMAIAIASLASKVPPHVKPVVFEVVFQIANGVVHEDALSRGNVDLVDRCRDIARRGLVLFYSEALKKSGEQAFDILDLIETDRRKLNLFRAHFKSPTR
ncbi:hypothetical protein [Nocardiopsis sp. CNT312]|uniref:hypothetical protein n=1 Tax=Nocardiopsis sp. CNT312 TaxID=1137268 RepID=UPI0012DC15ED|nr:hypothetical protein [Nocardiopsis sp. CNT312]